MSEKKSAVEVLAILGEQVRKIERQAAGVAAVIESMIAKSKRAAAPGPGPGVKP